MLLGCRNRASQGAPHPLLFVVVAGRAACNRGNDRGLVRRVHPLPQAPSHKRLFLPSPQRQPQQLAAPIVRKQDARPHAGREEQDRVRSGLDQDPENAQRLYCIPKFLFSLRLSPTGRGTVLPCLGPFPPRLLLRRELGHSKSTSGIHFGFKPPNPCFRVQWNANTTTTHAHHRGMTGSQRSGLFRAGWRNRSAKTPVT